MTVIKITQVMSEHELNEIVTVTVSHKFERLRRIFNVRLREDEKYPVWIDLMSDDGQDLLDEQLEISALNALWLLRDFYTGIPKKIWGKIKQPN